MHRHLYALSTAIILALSGCSMLPQSDTAADAATSEPAATKAARPATRPFPEDSFFDLLVAELSLRNRDFDTALTNYRQQAEKTGDPGLIETTARLADFLNEHETATIFARRWLEHDPQSSEAHFILASALSRLNRPLEALPHMQRVRELGGEANFAALAATALSGSEHVRETVFEKLQASSKANPNDTSLRIAVALMLQYRQQEEEALAQVRRVLMEDPDNAHALLIETRTLKQLNREDEMLERLKYAVDANPRYKRLRHDLARALVKASDLYQAKAQYEVLLQQSPQDSDILLELMLVNRELSIDDEAAEQLETLNKDPSQSSRAHYVLGRLAEEDKDWKKALSHYQHATNSPEFNEASKRIASISLHTEGVEPALKRLSELRSQLPDHADLLYLLEAEILRKESAYERGFALLSEALQQFPDNQQLLYARSLFAERVGDLDAVERDLRKILDQDPDNAAALNALGYTLANLSSRLDEAEELIKRALAQEPDDPAILDSYGWVLLRKGQVKEALPYLERAFKETKDDEIAAHLGEAYWLLGREDDAREAWQTGLKSTPDSQIIYRTLQRLNVVTD